MNSELSRSGDPVLDRIANHKTLKAVEKIDMHTFARYDMTASEMTLLYHCLELNKVQVIATAFKYGFIKGQRAQKRIGMKVRAMA